MERDRDSNHGSVAKSSTQRDALFKPRRSKYISSCHACDHLRFLPTRQPCRTLEFSPISASHQGCTWNHSRFQNDMNFWIFFIATGLHGCLVPRVWWRWQNLASLSSRSLLTSVRHACGHPVEYRLQRKRNEKTRLLKRSHRCPQQ